MTALIVTLILVSLGFIYYGVQDAIGKRQAADWADFVKANSHLFKKPEFKKLKKMTVTHYENKYE
jgi:hypothetical protein